MYNKKMEWGYFYFNDDGVPMCWYENNSDYNPTIPISSRNYKDFKKYNCDKKLAWKTAKTEISMKTLELLWGCQSVIQYYQQEDLDRFFETFCPDITWEYISCNRVIQINRSAIPSIQNEIYQKAIYRKMLHFNQIEYDNNLWYHNTFYYVPLLGKYYKRQAEKLKQLKDAAARDAVDEASIVLTEFKILLSNTKILLWFI